MGYSIVLGPTEEPLTLAEAKQHCRVDSTNDDGLIAGYILAARQWVESQIHGAICSRIYHFTFDYDWPRRCGVPYIELPMPPLQAVRSISYVDESGHTQALSASQYTVLSDKPVGVIVPDYDATWPSVRRQLSAITIRAVAGYSDFTDTTVSPNISFTGKGIPDQLRQTSRG